VTNTNSEIIVLEVSILPEFKFFSLAYLNQTMNIYSIENGRFIDQY
jgi:hypothetical protein